MKNQRSLFLLIGLLACKSENELKLNENTTPFFGSAALITPKPAYALNTLVCDATAGDDEDGVITPGYEWSVNGQLMGTGSSLLLTADVAVVGDSVVCTASAIDSSGNLALSEDVVIVENSPPVINGPVLSADGAYNDEMLMCIASATDPDEAVTVSYEWQLNGVFATTGDTIDLAAVGAMPGDWVLCTATAVDSGGLSDSASAMATVYNRPPSEPGIVLSPAAPVEQQDDLLCSIDSASTDEDGNSVNYAFEWSVNGSPYQGVPLSTGLTDDSISALETTVGEVWTCTVTPNDGLDDGYSASASVTIEEMADGVCNGHDPLGLNVMITESTSGMMESWETVVGNLGYSYSIVPLSALETNAFYATTDVLVVSIGAGDGVYSPTHLATIQGFIENGGSVYFQTEYQCTYSSNEGVDEIIANLGGNFSWNGTVAGDLNPTPISSCMSEKPDGSIIPPLSYFWYGCASQSSDAGYEPLVTYNGQDLGFTYCFNDPSYGMLISTSDQDWVRNTSNYTSAWDLMAQILRRLGSAPASCP